MSLVHFLTLAKLQKLSFLSPRGQLSDNDTDGKLEAAARGREVAVKLTKKALDSEEA